MQNYIIEIVLLMILVVAALIVYILFGDQIRAHFGISKRELEDVEPLFMIDYKIYKLSAQDILMYVLGGSGFAFAVAYVFYRNVILSAIFSLVYIVVVLKWPQLISNSLRDKRQYALAKQFKDALHAISSEITSGRSFSNILQDGAILNSLKIVYGEQGRKAYIIQEFTFIAKEMKNNATEESLLRDFANRSGIDDIRNFVDVMMICRRQGGDLNEVVKKTSKIIIEKMEIKEDIKTTVTQKKGEQTVMTILPVGMLLILSIVAPDYLAPMYETFIPGRLTMTIAMLLIVIAHYISKKIMDIEV